MGCTSSNSNSHKQQDFGKEEDFDFKPIHSAIRWNKPLPEIEVLLASSPWAINCTDKGNGNRPIHIAAQNGHTDVVRLLVNKKCLLNEMNMKGNTAIHMAVGYDYYDAAKLIIDAGGDPRILNSAGFPGNKGLEGDKTLAVAALVCAQTTHDVKSAFSLCEESLADLNKASFIAAGLKAKKLLQSGWTTELQDQFKSISNRI